jgi:AcrR family transcriptional regulator
MILKPEDPTVTSNLDHTGCGMKGRSMRVSEGEVQGPTRTGRRPSTSHDELQRAAFTLFADTGFDETSIDDIAASVGIAKRTFFRYFASKNDLVWGDFDAQLTRLTAFLDTVSTDVTMMEAIRLAVLEFNRLTPSSRSNTGFGCP